MSQLQITPSKEKEGVFIISGIITADANLAPLLQEPHSHLVFHFTQIREITSIGVRKWVEGLHALQKSGKTIEYQNCPEIFVEQWNLILEMTQGVAIHSFEISFICEDCDEEVLRMFKVTDLDIENLPPLIPCPSCQKEMITEEEDAFHFMETF